MFSFFNLPGIRPLENVILLLIFFSKSDLKQKLIITYKYFYQKIHLLMPFLFVFIHFEQKSVQVGNLLVSLVLDDQWPRQQLHITVTDELAHCIIYIPCLICYINTNSFRDTFFCNEIFTKDAILNIVIFHFMKSHFYFMICLNGNTGANGSFDIQMCTSGKQSIEIKFTFGDILWFWIFASICLMRFLKHSRFVCQNSNAMCFERLLAITITFNNSSVVT